MSARADVHVIELSDADRRDIDTLAGEDPRLTGASEEDAGFQQQACVIAHELPRGLRTGIREFQLNEPAAVCVVRGLRVNDQQIGPTPVSWRASGSGRIRREELTFYLIASLLGEPIAWSTKQDGRLMHDIVPVEGHEDEQLGSGSNVPLTWHTEDGFHPLRADYLGLLCLRNPDRVATTVATLRSVQLTSDTADVLHQERFEILPDQSHFQQVSDSVRAQLGDELISYGRARLEQMHDRPRPVSLLFGSRTDPYVRLDQFFARAVPGDEPAQRAFAEICDQMTAGLFEVVLEPGDVCFIDNYRAVHGRASFQPRYDGTDRWLKRLNLARDLRRSRHLRPSPESRLIV